MKSANDNKKGKGLTEFEFKSSQNLKNKKSVFISVFLFAMALLIFCSSFVFSALSIKNESSSQDILSQNKSLSALRIITVNDTQNNEANDSDQEILNESDETSITKYSQLQPNNTSPLIIRHEVYRIGDIVTINVESFDLGDLDIFISFSDATYKYLGNPEKEIFFSPKKTGNYLIELYQRSSALLLAKTEFSVVEDLPLPQNFSVTIQTDKQNYVIGESVHVFLSFDEPDQYGLTISFGQREYQYLGILEKEVLFVPRDLGIYNITLTRNKQPVSVASFLVINFSEGQNLSELPEANESISENKSSVNQSLNQSQNETKTITPNIRIIGLGDDFVDLKITKGGREWKNIRTNETYDVEIDLSEQRLIQQLELKQVMFEENKSIAVTVEDVQEEVQASLNREDAEKVQKAFAFDFDNVSSEEKAVFTAEAIGRELYQCKNWDPDIKKCVSSWQKVKDIIPGDLYRIEMALKPTGFMETGVAVVNTKKPIYHPNEAADILMVVLDTEGHLVGNASVTLEITDPLDKKSVFTSDDQIKEKERGIYAAVFSETSLEGNYSLKVSAFKDIPNEKVNFSMVSYFTVLSQYDFDINRNAPITIDPWSGPFTVSLSFEPLIQLGNQEFTVIETLPADFIVMAKGDAVEFESEDRKVLQWNNKKLGDILTYTAQAPFVSPDLVTLGKIKIKYGNQEFEEARPWYLAIDPPQAFSVKGTIFGSNNATQVPLATAYIINDTVSGFVVRSKTSNPIPGKSGVYSETITGNVGDLLRLTAWNQTYYGTIETTLTGNMNNVNYNITVIRSPETNVTILNLQNNSAVNHSRTFEVQASIEILGGTQCQSLFANLSISNISVFNFSDGETSSRNLGNVNYFSKVYPNWTLFGKNFGSANISIVSSCSNEDKHFYDTYKTSIYNVTVEDRVGPVINLSHPKNNSWTNITQGFFYYNVTQESTGIKNCSLFIDGIRNYTNVSLPVGQSLNFSLGTLPEGNHAWQVQCNDNTSYELPGSSYVWILNIDRTQPSISVVSPLNYFNTSLNALNFSYNVTDALSGVANCSLYIDGIQKQNDSTIQQNVSQNFSVFVNSGFHNWSVACSDNASNLVFSQPKYFNISNPDLFISSSLIFFSNDTPIGNDNITISATIVNIGTENATNVTAQFFLKNHSSVSNQLYGNFTFNLSAGENITINLSWIVQSGESNISVITDPPLETNGTIIEGNETNNNDSRRIYVTNWQWVFGDAFFTISLDASKNYSLFTWGNDTNTSINIYVIDADSNIAWNSLKAISRNMSNDLTTNDFSDIDNALNLSGFNDSVSSLFSNAGIPKHSENLILYQANVSFVPYINSSDSGNFITGILWDADDPNPGEYNGTQDLIFVTQEHRDSLGKYGTYDFEIRVPYALRKYVIPNSDDAVALYTEIR